MLETGETFFFCSQVLNKIILVESYRRADGSYMKEYQGRKKITNKT